MPKAIPPAAQHCKGWRVLIVSPHELTRLSLRYELEELGIECADAVDADTAFDRLSKDQEGAHPFDAAMLDLQLPGTDGHALAHEIRQRMESRALRLVLLAPLGQRLETDTLRAAGITGYLVKPVKQGRLWDCFYQLAQGRDGLATAFDSGGEASKINRTALFQLGTVLLVEDNLVNQKIALAQLRKLGVSADIAKNGREALDLIQRKPYSIVLMDCQMPDLDGYEATRAIRRSEADGNFGHRPTHVIIALTANAMEGDREKCLQVGMDDFLTKPFEIESLRTALEKAATSLGIRWDAKTQPLLPETVASVGAFPAASAVGHSSGVEFDRSFGRLSDCGIHDRIQ